ncbi:hypothetical protein AOLI_G00234920 [Acnodon oligacanthus]
MATDASDGAMATRLVKRSKLDYLLTFLRRNSGGKSSLARASAAGPSGLLCAVSVPQFSSLVISLQPPRAACESARPHSQGYRQKPGDSLRVKRLPQLPSVMETPAPARSSRLLLAYKSAAQHLLSKAGMRALQLQRSASAAEDKQRASPIAQLAALVLQRRRRRLALESPAPAPKPRNSRRVVVLGAPRVGKTSIVRRFLREDFEERYEPTREDFHRKLYHIRGEAYQIDILDPAGERDFPAKRRLTILTGDIFLLVLSLDDRGSFDEARSLRSEISRAKSALLRCPAEGARVPVVVCANKADLPAEERAVSRAELLRAFGGKDGACTLFETSAKEGGESLARAFEALAARAGLPVETGPSHHRRVSLRSYRRLGGGGRKAEAHASPCGALHPLARRPSMNADLRLVLATHGKKRTSKPAKK